MLLVAGSCGGSLRTRDAATGDLFVDLFTHPGATIRSVAGVAGADTWCVIASMTTADGLQHVEVWDVDNRKLLEARDAPASTLSAFLVAPDPGPPPGTWVAAVYPGGVQFVDLAGGSRREAWFPLPMAATSGAIVNDRLYLGGAGGFLALGFVGENRQRLTG